MENIEESKAAAASNSDLQWIPVESISYLIHSVRPKSKDDSEPVAKQEPNDGDLEDTEQPRLGNFDSVWHFLGVPAERTPTNIKILDESEAASLTKKKKSIDHQDTPAKGVKWRDEVKSGDKLEEYTTRKYLMTLTKSQRKLARKDRQKLKGRRFSSEGESSESESAKGKSNKFRKTGSSRSPTLPAVFDASSEDEKQTSTLTTEIRKSVIGDLLGHDTTPKKNETPSHSQRPTGTSNLGLEVSHTGRIQILPLLNEVERKEQLQTKLFTNFPQDRTTLAKLTMPIFLSNVGIYIFIDFSNILIGFYECLKKARGIAPDEPHIRRTPFSFKNFSKVLERGRSCSRRVIVGSLPETSAITEAKELGYDVNLLERVHKMRDMATRRNSQSGKSSGMSGMSSGSETTARFQMRLVEQGVDELLQMKMLESLLDASAPTTAVLATGDGAVAEYSEGFFKVVERFLERDWTIELVSFKKQTNWCYKDPAFRRKWGGKFKLTLVDEYCEYLFGDLA